MSLEAAHVKNLRTFAGIYAEHEKRKTLSLLNAIAYLRQATNCMNQFRLLKLQTSLPGRMKQLVKSNKSKFKHFLRNEECLS